MNRTSADSSRTAELWQRMGGLFGADALERKFGREIPTEWRGIVERMPIPELERGMRRLVYSGKAHVPTLPEFVKLCKAVGDDGEFGGPKGAAALPPPPQTVTDAWGAQANFHLLAYVQTRHRDFRGGMQYGGHPAPWLTARTQILVRWKNEWARLMRESDESDRESAAQKSLWAACMSQAEDEIASTPAARQGAA